MADEEQPEQNQTGMVIVQGNPAVATCKVLSKNGKPCGQPVVSEGIPFCYLHMRETDNTGRARRYFDVAPAELQEALNQQIDEMGHKDLTGEIAIARAIVSFILQRVETRRDTDGKITFTKEDTDTIERYLYVIKGSVESQAKVNPPQVITFNDMKKIITDIIGIIDSNLPREMSTARARIVREIEKYCMTDLITRAMELPFGGTPKKQHINE
jgi:hypothetical protein